ncbi:MAG: NUDIX domain-containing protein [Candidatus Omnitrophica bacterium]|nr:NUDIX domain-containing protein [Candidatus Omnitrophota bacterium]
MIPSGNKVTVSAGGVVVNTQGMILVVNQNGNSWSLPKGHVEIGEEPLTAARREIAEEAGISNLEYVRVMGSYGRYKLGKNEGDDKKEWKILLFFLFKAKNEKLNPTDPRHPQARWVYPDEVEKLLTHPKDKAFFNSVRLQIL